MGNVDHLQGLLLHDLSALVRESKFAEKAAERRKLLDKYNAYAQRLMSRSKKEVMYNTRSIKTPKEELKLCDPSNEVRQQMLQEQYNRFAAGLESAREGLEYAEAFADAVESAIDDADKCMENEDHNILVMLLLESYYEVCGISLGIHHGGNSHSGGTQSTLLANWDKIVQYFYTTVDLRLGDLIDLCALRNILVKTTECFIHLREMELIFRKQEKVTVEDSENLNQATSNLIKTMQKYYPNVNVWWKLHYSCDHMVTKARANGMIGRPSAQGFEGWHSKYFLLRHVFISSPSLTSPEFRTSPAVCTIVINYREKE